MRNIEGISLCVWCRGVMRGVAVNRKLLYYTFRQTDAVIYDLQLIVIHGEPDSANRSVGWSRGGGVTKIRVKKTEKRDFKMDINKTQTK